MKKVIILMLLLSTMLIGCSEVETHANGVPTYFLEPEGHIIAKVKVVDDSFWYDRYLYGYITEEDYASYLNGSLNKILIVKNPYEEGKQITTMPQQIISIEVGVYKDLRYED